MAICSNEICNEQALENTDKCILHIEKYNYNDQLDNCEDPYLFEKILVDYIARESLKINEESDPFNSSSVKTYLFEKDRTKEFEDYFKKITIVLKNICFPSLDGDLPFSYIQILEKLKSLHFMNCSFSGSSIDIKNIGLFFDECTFNKRWFIKEHDMTPNVSSVLYQNCLFKEDVDITTSSEKPFYLHNDLFRDCDFKKKLIIENAVLEKQLFKNTKSYETEIGTLKLSNSTFDGKFLLNN